MERCGPLPRLDGGLDQVSIRLGSVVDADGGHGAVGFWPVFKIKDRDAIKERPELCQRDQLYTPNRPNPSC